MVEILPRCVIGNTEHFISADGLYFPCCFINDAKTTKQYLAYIGEANRDQIDTNLHTLAEILDSSTVRRLHAEMHRGLFPPCAMICRAPTGDSVGSGGALEINIDLKSKTIWSPP